MAQTRKHQQRTQPKTELQGEGWLLFASTVFLGVGFFGALEGLAAIFQDDVYVAHGRRLLVLSYTQWGWTHLIMSVLVILVAFAIWANKPWARVVGVILALANAVLQMAFLSAMPVWGLIIIALDFLVIFALTVPRRIEVR